MVGEGLLQIEVAYAGKSRYKVISLQMPEGSNLGQAIFASRILNGFPEIDLRKCQVAIHGERATMQSEIVANDRIEILRPLPVSPRLGRKMRQQRQKD